MESESSAGEATSVGTAEAFQQALASVLAVLSDQEAWATLLTWPPMVYVGIAATIIFLFVAADVLKRCVRRAIFVWDVHTSLYMCETWEKVLFNTVAFAVVSTSSYYSCTWVCRFLETTQQIV